MTLPSEIPAGASSSEIERLLEIGAGKGANYIELPGSIKRVDHPCEWRIH